MPAACKFSLSAVLYPGIILFCRDGIIEMQINAQREVIRGVHSVIHFLMDDPVFRRFDALYKDMIYGRMIHVITRVAVEGIL